MPTRNSVKRQLWINFREWLIAKEDLATADRVLPPQLIRAIAVDGQLPRSFYEGSSSYGAISFAAAGIKATKVKQCQKGYSCGFSCVAKTKACKSPLPEQGKTYAEFLSNQLKTGGKLLPHHQADADALGLTGHQPANQSKGLTPEQRQRANAVLEQVARAKAAKAPESKPEPSDPKPPSPKTHSDLIDHGQSLLPPALTAELDRLRKAAENHSYEVTGKILGELNAELAAVRSGKAGRSEAEIISEGRVYQQKQTKFEEETLGKAAALMSQFRQSLITQSPISQKQAEAMASKIKIDKNAATVIPEQALRQQSAEFYRLTGGRGASTIDDFTKDSDRAYASEGKRVVNIGNSRQKSIVFHEMAHHIEFEDNTVGQASLDWIRSRAEGKAQKIKDLTGNANYKDSEIAYPDHFVSPYVGKIYAHKENGQIKLKPNTEVVSMGVERFSDPLAMVKFYLKDPEHFKFTLGAIRQ